MLVYRVDPEIGAHTSAPYDLDDPPVDEATMWANYRRFLDAVLPEAERAGVRLALHPADPPVLGLGGAARLFRDVSSFERADALAGGSPAWGLNLCLGCCSEMPGGASNVFRMIERFGPTGRIAYVHVCDVQGSPPSFRECFIGEGNFDPAEVVMALDAVGFDGFLLDDHVPHVIDDTPWGTAAGATRSGISRACCACCRSRGTSGGRRTPYDRSAAMLAARKGSDRWLRAPPHPPLRRP